MGNKLFIILIQCNPMNMSTWRSHVTIWPIRSQDDLPSYDWPQADSQMSDFNRPINQSDHWSDCKYIEHFNFWTFCLPKLVFTRPVSNTELIISILCVLNVSLDHYWTLTISLGLTNGSVLTVNSPLILWHFCWYCGMLVSAWLFKPCCPHQSVPVEVLDTAVF